jgi:hypothetical protein
MAFTGESDISSMMVHATVAAQIAKFNAVSRSIGQLHCPPVISANTGATWYQPRSYFFFFFLWRGLIYSKGAANFFLVEGAYTQQGRAHIRRPRSDWAARPALMGRAAHAVESKAVVRIEVAVSPRPCLGCAVEELILMLQFSK